MWRNYLTVGIRSLAKNRAYALINVLGLAIGMAACLMILLFVRYERSYDAALPGADRAYQFQTSYRDPDTGQEDHYQVAAYISKQALLKDFPQIDLAVHSAASEPVMLKDGMASTIENFHFVDGPLLRILQFPLAKGNPATALTQVGTLVMTQSEAAKRFGSEDPMGKTVSIVGGGKTTDYRVVGILKDLPKNSHFKATMIARYDPNVFFADQPDFLKQWGWQGGWIYVSLKPGADADAINAQMKAWEKRNIPDEVNGDQVSNPGDAADYELVNVRDVHLGLAQGAAMTPGNSQRSIATFAVIALLILGMACINFTNLATARASQRAREVALRKVLGANRGQLILQFVGESVLVAALAMLLALAIVELTLPAFAAFLDADLAMRYFGQGGLLPPIVLLVFLVGAVGGLYPAFYLSRFQPARVLKANKSASDTEGSGRLRNILVVGQFAVSIGLIVCTGVIYAQTVYARTTDPGYRRDHILQVDSIGRRQLLPVADALTREIGKVDGVRAAGRSGIGIATRNNRNTGIQVPGRKDPVLIGSYSIDTGFLDAMGIGLLAGRNFSESRAMDDATTPFPREPEAERALAARGINVVINALAAKRLGLGTPQDAIGKSFKMTTNPEYGGVLNATVIGVVQDSRFRSIREPIDPIVFQYNRNDVNVMAVRYHGDPAAVRARIETTWKRMVSEAPFEAHFSEEIIGDLYKAEDSRAIIFAAFSALAVIVGCLGLFGLAAFTAERRTKEIGIRKVLGASTSRIVQLLIWQFSRPVLIANLIAWPVAWWLMRDWLNTFDARIALTPAPFVAAGLLALAIAVATIAAHSYRVARTNPIHALRYE